MMEHNELLLEVFYVNPDLDSDDEPEVYIELEDGSLYTFYKNIIVSSQFSLSRFNLYEQQPASSNASDVNSRSSSAITSS